VKSSTDDIFAEVKILLASRDYECAYEVLERVELSNNPKASAIKAFLNYCEYVQCIPKDQALESLKKLSQENCDDATYLLATTFMLPGIYESLPVAIPYALSLCKVLYEKENAKGAILYADLLRVTKNYDDAWIILEDAKSFDEVELASIYTIQKNIINESQNHVAYLPKLFRKCEDEYKKGNKVIFSVYLQFLLNKDSEFFNLAFGLQVLEEGILENNYACKILKAILLTSFEWYVKRDIEEAEVILREIINEDKNEVTAKIILSQIYMNDKKYRTPEHGKEVIQLLGSIIWYGNLPSTNLLLATIKHYKLFDSEYFLDALKAKAKLEGKYSATKFMLFKFFYKTVATCVDSIWKISVLIVSYFAAFILASVRVLIFYIPNLIRLWFK
jgi:hypothetical protein